MMKLTIILLFISIFALGQASKKDSKATVSVLPNQVQIDKLNEAYNEKQKIEVRITELTELVIGHKIDEVDSLRVDNGQFKFVLKPKKK